MTCNDILGRLRYILNYDDAEMVAVFAAADHVATEEQVKHWLLDEKDPLFAKLSDRELATFLNGLINHKRGKRPGPAPVPENRLTNNLIATKLKIALNLKGPDMIRILALADFQLSNHELSAFFRKPGHKHFRKMNDQVLRNFLQGLSKDEPAGRSLRRTP
jgi:uncharacterized protein YehS (DUF1456 family)